MIPRIFFEVPDREAYRHRYDIGTPFVAEGFLMSTDGRIAVLAPESAFAAWELAPYRDPKRRLPDPNKVLKYWHDWADARGTTGVDLPASVRDREVCSRCHPGAPWAWPFVPAGRPWCEDCDGDGWMWVSEGIDLGGSIIAPRHVALLRRHGVSRLWQGNTPAEPLCFAGDGFDGLLMPCYPKLARRDIPGEAVAMRA